MTDTASSTAGPSGAPDRLTSRWTWTSGPTAHRRGPTTSAWPATPSRSPSARARDPRVPPPGPGFWSVTRFDDVMHVSRHPEIFCSAQGHQHPRPAGRDRRVLRLDDQHGRAPPHPHAPDREPGVHAPHGGPHRRRRPRQGPARSSRPGRRWASATSSTDLAAPLPLQIICEMMGIPERGVAPHLRADQHHPGRRRPRLRRLRDADGGHPRDGPDRPGRRRGPPGQPPGRPGLGDDARRGRRRDG